MVVFLVLHDVNSLEVLGVIFENCSPGSQTGCVDKGSNNAGGPFMAFVILACLAQDYHQI